MQPISYDLFTIPTPWFSIPLLIVGILATIGGLILLVRSRMMAFGSVLFVLGLFTAVCGALLIVSEDRADFDARNELISTKIEEGYGVKLDGDRVRDLDYPTMVPEEDFKRYGSVTISEQVEGADFIERQIYLVWADDSLQLSQSIDGENFEQLDRRD